MPSRSKPTADVTAARREETRREPDARREETGREPDARRIWRPDWPCLPHDVLRPLRRGSGDPAYQHDPDGTVWRATRTPDGPVTLRLRPRPADGVIDCRAWGPGAAWSVAQVPVLLGAHDDIADFRPADPRVRAAWDANPHWRVAQTGLVFESLVAAIIEQKVTGKEAWFGWRALLRRYGTVAPGPGEQRRMRCLPTPSEVALIPSWEWLRMSIDQARSRTVVRAAERAAALERTYGLPPAVVERRLTSLPGIGVWTAAEVRQRAHGDADAVSFGDYHVATHVGWALLGVPTLTDDGLAELLAPETPHRYRIQHVVTTRMSGRPRRGPRMAPRRHLPV